MAFLSGLSFASATQTHISAIIVCPHQCLPRRDAGSLALPSSWHRRRTFFNYFDNPEKRISRSLSFHISAKSGENNDAGADSIGKEKKSDRPAKESVSSDGTIDLSDLKSWSREESIYTFPPEMVLNKISEEHDETLLVTKGRDHTNIAVNPAVYHASTIMFKTCKDMLAGDKNPFDGPYYGRWGTPTTFALEEAVAKIEGAYRCIATSSGNAAMSTALLSFLQAGDHILVMDTVYEPTRRFCSGILGRFGVEVEFFAPDIGGKIMDLVRDNTKVVFLEAPGSLTFEVPDIMAITAPLKGTGILTMIDNTWATPLFFKPYQYGIDISITAATKYLCGHSDVMMGIIGCSNREQFEKMKVHSSRLGCCPGPDDCYMVLRGVRTLSARLRIHQESALNIARWLQEEFPEVKEVLHPALPTFESHANFKRYFRGSTGLFSVILQDEFTWEDMEFMLDNYKHFKIGFSWGGFESLAMPVNVVPVRTAVPWTKKGPVFRLHIGLENINDLKLDLAMGFMRLRQAREARLAATGSSPALPE